MRHEAQGYFDRIESVGGMISAIETGFFRREIADAAFAYQREVDAKRKLIVGVNAFVEADEKSMETLTLDDSVERDQIATLHATQGRVEAGELRRCLGEVRRAAATSQNLVGPLLQAAHARASVGEMMDALADVFGRYEPNSA
jgi:methylmalonyl-CoA mutase N-terminal domain/subunit